MYYSTTKNWVQKTKKKLCRGPSLALGKGDLCFAEGLTNVPRQRKLKKNLCRGPSLALGKGDLCRGLGQWPSAKKI